MIHSRGAHKVTSSKFKRDRGHALRDPDSVTAAEKDFLGVTDLVRGNKFNEQAYKIITEPADIWDHPKRTDIRESHPYKGGK
jgi:hypothetical protein